MFQLTASSGMSRRIVHVLGISLMAVGAIVAMRDGAFGGLIVTLYAAAVLGGLPLWLLVRRSRQAPDDQMRDKFLSDGLSTDVINFSRIRITGVGGLGLVAVAFAIALSLPPVGVSMAAAVVGGIFLSFVLISYRRRHAGRWP